MTEDHTTCVSLHKHLDMLLVERQRAVELIAHALDHKLETMNRTTQGYDERLKAMEHSLSNMAGRRAVELAIMAAVWTVLSSVLAFVVIRALQQHTP